MAYPETVVKALMKGVPAPSLSGAIATTSPSVAYAVPISAKNLVAMVTGASTISSGVVTIEEASAPDYAGTWAVSTTVSATNVSGGAQVTVHLAGTYRAVRARVSTAIAGGGNVGVDFTCN